MLAHPFHWEHPICDSDNSSVLTKFTEGWTDKSHNTDRQIHTFFFFLISVIIAFVIIQQIS